MRRSHGDVGPFLGCRKQYSTVQFSTAQHMIYHTISRKQNKGVWPVWPSQARQLKSNQANPNATGPRAQMPRQTGWQDGVKTPEAKPAALPS